MSKNTIVSALVATFILASFALLNRQQAPSTGALTLSPDDTARVPNPVQQPTIVVGEKTKLFMNNNAYLFGAKADSPDSAALSNSENYRVGVGKEFERASGSKLMGEVSFISDEKTNEKNDEEALLQARLAAAYLTQLNKHSDFRAGISTDLASNLVWSTLELQLSMELEDGLYLMFNHDYGKSMNDSAYDHQTGIVVEKKF